LGGKLHQKIKLKLMTQLIKDIQNSRWSANKWLITIEMMFCPVDYSRQTIQPDTLIDFLKLLENNRCDFISRFTDVITASSDKAKNIFFQLIATSDKIFITLKKLSHSNVSVSDKTKVRKAYIHMMNIIESLLKYCGNINKGLSHAINLTKFASILKRTELRRKIVTVSQQLKNSTCNPCIIAVILRNLQEIVQANAIQVDKLDYANMLIKKMISIREIKDEAIVDLLIKMNFNSPDFFDFCVEEYNKIINDDCLYTQIELIVSLEESLNNIKPHGEWRLNRADNSIKDQLLYFFALKKNYLEKRLDIRRTHIADKKFHEDLERIETTLTVSEMSFLIKLFMEHNILPTKNIGKIYIFFAKNFSTTRAKFISADSLHKKASTVEFSTTRKVKGLLLTMVAWINKHHHADNYAD
jgi:hypothetical protein